MKLQKNSLKNRELTVTEQRKITKNLPNETPYFNKQYQQIL
jgi:hypothetical protein